jgi:hypothetical protein
MMSGDGNLQELGKRFLGSLDETHRNAAASKFFAASPIFSRSPAHKHYSLADIEWTVVPPVAAGQFYVVEITDKERGFRAPVAAVTWALVSQEVDARLRTGPFKERSLNLIAREGKGVMVVSTLDALTADCAGSSAA